MLKIGFLVFLAYSAKLIQWPEKLGSKFIHQVFQHQKEKHKKDGNAYVQLEMPKIEQNSKFWNHIFSEGY